jgi:hypothetical protein
MRAYVTGGASADAQTSAMRTRCGLTPRRVASSRLAGTHAARRPRVATPHGAAISGYGSDEGRRRLSCSAGARPLRWQRSGQRWRDGPRRSTGTREGSTRTGSRAAPLHSRCWMYAPRWARSSTLLRTRSAVQTGATNHVARSSEGQPFTTGMNAWPGLSRLVQVPTWRPGYYIAANADDYFRPSRRRPLLQCCRRLATPSLVAFATDQIYRSLQGRVTTATPMPEALDFMGGLTIKPS